MIKAKPHTSTSKTDYIVKQEHLIVYLLASAVSVIEIHHNIDAKQITPCAEHKTKTPPSTLSHNSYTKYN